MMTLVLTTLMSASTLSFGQGHNTLQGTGMKDIAFLQGSWHGKQSFNTGGPAMVLDITNQISEAVGGRYLEERLATTRPGGKPTDSRHFITFDPTSKQYQAWWFNDTSIGPMELDGTLEKTKLVLQTKPTGVAGEHILRATYSVPTANSLDYTLELQDGGSWRLLFTSRYTK